MRLNRSFFLVLFATIFCGEMTYAQHLNLPMNYNLTQQLEMQVLSSDSGAYFHSAVRPSVQTFVSPTFYAPVYNDTGKYYYAFTEKLFQKNLLSVEEKDVRLVADPLFNFTYGKTRVEDTLLKISSNVRGVRVAGDITRNFSFETRVYETQQFYPVYLDSIAGAKQTSLGIGRSKPFKGRGYDATMSSGVASFSPSKQVNLQFGRGKHFIGDGYRSLLLSDNMSPVPFFNLSLRLFKGKLHYQSLNTWMQNRIRIPATHSAEALFKRKAGAFHYLSYAVNSHLQIGLFEGAIYKNYEENKGMVALPYDFYLPVIGVPTLLNGLNGVNNSLLGVNVKVSLFKQLVIYGQYMQDDVNKNGFQIGGKWLRIKGLKNSWVQIEYNTVSDFAYTRSTSGLLENYTHDNQELAHPLGAGFNEFLVLAHFEKERYFVNFETLFYSKKYYSSAGLGTNVLLANDLPQEGIFRSKVNYSGIEVGYLFNRKTNMQLFSKYNYRNELVTSSLSENPILKFESFWQIGFRTNLNNYYYDM